LFVVVKNKKYFAHQKYLKFKTIFDMILIKKYILLTKVDGYEQNGYFCKMDVVRKLFDFYLNASIHVALSVYCFVRITEKYFDLRYNEALDYFIFYGTITGYNFVKYFGIAKFHHRSLTKDLKVIQLFSFFCFLLMCYYALQLPLSTLLWYLPFGALTILYAIPFLSGFQKNLRNISYLKIVVVALVWAGVSVVIPIMDAEETIENPVVWYLFLQRFILVSVLILPFDIRDVRFDAISLQTIPKKIGEKNTKKLGFLLLSFALLLEFLIAPNSSFKTVFLLVFFALFLLLMRATVQQSKYYSSFWVELLPILWCLVLFGFTGD